MEIATILTSFSTGLSGMLLSVKESYHSDDVYIRLHCVLTGF